MVIMLLIWYCVVIIVRLLYYVYAVIGCIVCYY